MITYFEFIGNLCLICRYHNCGEYRPYPRNPFPCTHPDFMVDENFLIGPAEDCCTPWEGLA